MRLSAWYHFPARMTRLATVNLTRRGLLLEYVVLEVMTVLMARRDLAVAARVGQILLDAQEPDFVPCSDFSRKSWRAFRRKLEHA